MNILLILIIYICVRTHASNEKNSAAIYDYEQRPLRPESEKTFGKRLVGRHVCTHSKIVMKPAKGMQTYCKPVYQTYLRRCIYKQTDYCTGYKVSYQTSYRPVQKMIPQTVTEYKCCPGWSQSWLHDKKCMKATCSKKCFNGGTCLKPDKCICQPGWTGPSCETDIDECESKPNACEQKCINIPGSYKCSCDGNFLLHSDGRSCIPKCQPQSENCNQKFDEIMRRVEQLEQHLRFLNLAEINRRLYQLEKTEPNCELITDKCGYQNITSPPVDTNKDRIHSLSEQIAILEERLDECSCQRRDIVEPTSAR